LGRLVKPSYKAPCHWGLGIRTLRHDLLEPFPLLAYRLVYLLTQFRLIAWSFARIRSGGDFRLIRKRPWREVKSIVLSFSRLLHRKCRRWCLQPDEERVIFGVRQLLEKRVGRLVGRRTALASPGGAVRWR
jgi:hypothetical protein